MAICHNYRWDHSKAEVQYFALGVTDGSPVNEHQFTHGEDLRLQQ